MSKYTRIAKPLTREKHTVSLMIALYCHAKHGKLLGKKRGELCPSCSDLLAYTHERLDRCPQMQSKPFCSHCHIHCYTPERRAQICAVMRYAGPRMLFFHPVQVVSHAARTLFAKVTKLFRQKQ